MANEADQGHLTIYAGAGISMSEPTGLPGARGLSHLIAEQLGGVVDFHGIDQGDLLAVADAVASVPSGERLLRQTVLQVTDLLGARPNYGHEVLALLLCEGVATVLETNYDTCVERAAQPEVPDVVRTNVDLLHGASTALLKAHGCATRTETMLVTSEDLAGTPLWAQVTVQALLARDQFVFVGIGSVADYVRTSIEGVFEAVGADHVLVVDPSMAYWESDPNLDWRRLFESLGFELPPAQRLARDASDFLDSLLRAFTRRVVRNAAEMIAGYEANHPQRAGTEAVIRSLSAHDAVRVLRWLRGATWKVRPGESVVKSAVTTTALLSLGALSGNAWSFALYSAGWVKATRSVPTQSSSQEGVDVMTLCVPHGADGAGTAREAHIRVAEARRSSHLEPGTDVLVVVVGNVHGALGPEEVPVPRGANLAIVLSEAHAQLNGMPTDLLGEAPADHLIDGVRSGQVYFVNGDSLAEARAA